VLNGCLEFEIMGCYVKHFHEELIVVVLKEDISIVRGGEGVWCSYGIS
jgi:hypothetical protein